MTWRLVTHDAIRCTLAEVETHYSTDDVCDAHDILDWIDDERARRAT